MLRLCHKLITCSIARRSYAHEKEVCFREVMDAMARDLSRFTVWAAGGISQQLDSIGATYVQYSETHVPYQRRRVRQRTVDASTLAAPLDEDQLDP
ncbi:hypothetical protein Tco_1389047 [Tanacetum coccineum]